MIKKTSLNQPCGRDSECKMVRFKVPQYISNQVHPAVNFASIVEKMS